MGLKEKINHKGDSKKTSKWNSFKTLLPTERHTKKNINGTIRNNEMVSRSFNVEECS